MRRTAFSVCMPFHNNQGMLKEHYAYMRWLPDVIKAGIELVICDDASEERAFYPIDDLGFPVNIFRIPPPHIPWSHRCATNIAVHEAKGFWRLVTDIDHLVPAETWRYLMDPARPYLRTDYSYTFQRRNVDGSAYKSHPDSWLFHCSLWDKIGGYDTRLRGYYGQNKPFQTRVTHHVEGEAMLPVPLVRYSRDDIPDASERVLPRKSPEARSAIAGLTAKFRREGSFLEKQPLVEYEKVIS